MAEAFPTIVHLLGSCPAIIHLLGSRVARLALCIRGTLGKGTLRMYPSLRVPTAGTGSTMVTVLNMDMATE
jgi:hypothetical protein